VSEPTSPEAVAAWTEAAQRERDPFERVRLASHEHRGHHGPGCSVYPTSSGPLLSVLAAAIKAERILELGCGLGYSALCLAHDSHGLVETIERDPDHVRLAETEIEREGYSDRIRVLPGSGSDVLPGLEGHYDLVFSDGDPEEMPLDLHHFLRLLRTGGVLVSANLFLAQFVPDLTGIPQMAEYRRRILEDDRLLTAMIPGGLALSVARKCGRRDGDSFATSAKSCGGHIGNDPPMGADGMGESGNRQEPRAGARSDRR
jgi:predicted O-methyltransferase YrrM